MRSPRPLVVALFSVALVVGCAARRAPEPGLESGAVRTVQVDGPAGQLRVLDAGAGANAILFVHGLGGTAEIWSEQLETLGRARRAVALDLRGHGRSGSNSGDFGLDAVCADVEAVADALRLERPVLVGHSWGGLVVAHCAARRPAGVAGVVMVDPPWGLWGVPQADAAAIVEPYRTGEFSEKLPAFFDGMFVHARPGLRDRVLADARPLTREAFFAIWDSLRAWDSGRDLTTYSGPVLLVAAGQGPLQTVRQAYPHIRYAEVDQVSHWLMCDKPAEFNALLEDFVAALPR